MLPNKNYPVLNGLRAVAAIAVVCFHYCPRSGKWWEDAILAAAPAGVGFFFMLSGFVLTIRHDHVAEKSVFWRARLLRIYPMYLLAFLLFAPLAFEKYHTNHGLLLSAALLNIVMLQSWTPLAQSWNGPSWSLSVEAFLYFVFPFLLARVRKLASLALWMTLALTPAAVTVFLCNGWVPATVWRSWIGNNPAFFLPVFCFGILLAEIRRKSEDSTRNRDIEIGVTAVAIVALAALWPSAYRPVLVNGGELPLLAALVLLSTYKSRLTHVLLGNAVMDRLGRASYITYIMQAPLWHYYVIATNLITRLPLTSRHTDLTHFLVFLVLLLAASVALDLYVDEPARRLLSKPSASRPVRLEQLPSVAALD